MSLCSCTFIFLTYELRKIYKWYVNLPYQSCVTYYVSSFFSFSLFLKGKEGLQFNISFICNMNTIQRDTPQQLFNTMKPFTSTINTRGPSHWRTVKNWSWRRWGRLCFSHNNNFLTEGLSMALFYITVRCSCKR